MKMLVSGVKNLFGFSKKSNNDFEMPFVFGLVKVENFKKDNLQCVGFGYEPMEVRLDPDCIKDFAQFEGKFPLMLDLETDVAPFMGEPKTIVIGAKALAAPAAIKAA